VAIPCEREHSIAAPAGRKWVEESIPVYAIMENILYETGERDRAFVEAGVKVVA